MPRANKGKGNPIFDGTLSDTNASMFEETFNSLKGLWDSEFDIYFDPNGVYIHRMDSHKVMMTSIIFKPEMFKNYSCEKCSNVGLNIGSMLKILNCRKTKQETSLTIDEKASSLLFSFQEEEDDHSTSFQMSLMNTDVESLMIPPIQYTVIIRMPTKTFKEQIKDLAKFGDTFCITVNKDHVVFESSGGDIVTDIGTSIWNHSHGITVKYGGDISQRYTMKYMVNISQMSSYTSPFVIIGLMVNHPILIEYILGNNLGIARFYLAPKITDDDMG